MKKILITLIILLVLPLVLANVYEFEINYNEFKTNSEASFTVNELNYTVFDSWPITCNLYNGWDDTQLGTVVYDGVFIGDTIDGIFYGKIILNNETEMSPDISIKNPYNGFCVAENNTFGCFVSNEQGFNAEGYFLSGEVKDGDNLYILGYKEFEALIGDGYINETNIQGNIFGFYNGYMTVGYGSDINLFNFDELINSNFNGTCYYLNNESWNVEMENIICIGVMNYYIDYDNDNFTSDVDCNDNNASINPNATEINDNDVDENCDGVLGKTPAPSPTSPSTSSGGGSSCKPEWECQDWNEVPCSEDGLRTRECILLNSCNKNKPETARTCTYYPKVVEESEIVEETSRETPEVTGAVVGTENNTNIIWLLTALGLLVVGIGGYLYYKKK